MIWTIYRISNLISGKVYIGQTSKPINQRWKEHCYVAVSKSQQKKKLHKAIQSYGVKQFQIDAVDTAQTLDEANDKERQWILKLDSINSGYNLTCGGDSGFWIGQKHSQQSKDKIGAWSKGKPKSIEHRLKIGLSNRGKTISQDTKDKLAAYVGNRSNSGKIYRITNSNGETFVVKSLLFFCKTHNLKSSTLYGTLRTKFPTRDGGWLVERV